jgi:hypothetical protein
MLWLIRSIGIKRVKDCYIGLIGEVHGRILGAAPYTEDGVCARDVVEVLDDLFGKFIGVAI